ncbi:hypothetical protein ACOBQX_23075 [Actinokineospora sp. G85]|uniref:hypothetical protein n=1 Tax=Actinokineospora sp. G85 TaxID=3406626 RepID=UPI003C72AA7E
MIDNGWAPHSARYYVVVLSALAIASVLALLFFDGATWLSTILGGFTGGFIVDAVVDRAKRRKLKQAEHTEGDTGATTEST